jgi:tetratricopeptide (TPR) repeat protein
MRRGETIFAAVLLAAPLSAQTFEARTPYFRVAAAGPSEVAVNAALGLERTRARFAALGLPVGSQRTDVLIFADIAAMQPYAPQENQASGRAIGFFRQGPERLFIAMAWKEAGDPQRVLAHELAHQAVWPLVKDQPLWFREGLADLLSNLQPAEGGWRVGLPITAHLEALRQGAWLDWQEVRAARDSSFLDNPGLNRLFYAQSWLLVHRLLVGRLGSGLSAAIAESPAPADFPASAAASLATEILFSSGPAEPASIPAIRETEPWEYRHRLAELLRALGRTEDARRALLALRSEVPGRPEPAESLGALEMDALRYEQAEEQLAEAVRLNSENAATHHRYALLLMRPGHSAAAAARHARRAVELDSGEPRHWLAQAQAEMQLANWEPARVSVTEMRQRTTDPLLLGQAQTEWDEIERRRQEQLHPPRPPRPSSARITVAPLPEPEPPPAAPAPAESPAPAPVRAPENPFAYPGTVTFVGYLRRVECGPAEKILTVSNRRLAIRVRERNGEPARLYYAPKGMRRIPCDLQNAEVNVVYRPLGGADSLNGDVVAVIF